MTTDTQSAEAPRIGPWRIAGWGLAATLLLLPAVAMQFTAEVDWTASDFVFAAVLIGGSGLLLELIARKSPDNAYRAAAGFALLAAFLTIWANGAVGMIGDEDNPYNLLFRAVLVVALLGAVLARFRPRGMALAMVVSGIVYTGIALGGLATDPRGAVFSLGFATLWLLSAALFHTSGKA